jgi:murein DD-endopeptidase MepM/ murein hydrolase activator NlpD
LKDDKEAVDEKTVVMPAVKEKKTAGKDGSAASAAPAAEEGGQEKQAAKEKAAAAISAAKKPAKPKKYYTIKFFSSEKGEDVRSLRLSEKALKGTVAGVAAGALLFIGAFSYSVYATLSARDSQAEVQELRTVNQIQQEQLLELSKKAYSLQEQMQNLTQLEQDLRRRAGVGPATDSAQGSAQDGSQDGDAASSDGSASDEGGQESGDESGEGASLRTQQTISYGAYLPSVRPPEGLLGGQGGPAGSTASLDDVRAVFKSLEQEMGKRQASLNELQDELKAQETAPGAFALGLPGGAGITTPSLWPANGTVSSPFGFRWGGTDFHPGIDIANDMGTPIVATADGTVVTAGWNSGGYGNMVDIDHGNGIMTRYGHAMQVVVVPGQHVRRGQIIAYMGSTGYSTGPHVHYEVRINGSPVNPAGYL